MTGYGLYPKIKKDIDRMPYDYLMGFTGVGIVQEHAANKIIKDLVNCCKPEEMSIELEYKVRGGIVTKVSVTHKK